MKHCPSEKIGPLEEDVASNHSAICSMSEKERDTYGIQLRDEIESKMRELLSLGPSQQVITLLHNLSEIACGILGTQLYRFKGKPSLPPPQRRNPKPSSLFPYPPRQYVDWKRGRSIYENNLKCYLTVHAGDFPTSNVGIDHLYHEITFWVSRIESIREREEFQEIETKILGSEFVNAAITLPPLSSKTVNQWAHVINMKAEISDSELDLSNFHRDCKRLKEQIDREKMNSPNIRPGVKLKKVADLEVKLKRKEDDGPSANDIAQGRISAIRKRLKNLVRLMEEKKAEPH